MTTPIPPAWVFLVEDGESIGNRLARCCQQALKEGPIGNTLHPDLYREIISCGFDPALLSPFADGDIGEIKTSCGVFVRAMLHWSGRIAKKAGRVGGALIGGWVPDIWFRDKAWVDAKGVRPIRNRPTPGCIFYRGYGIPDGKKITGVEGHVGIFIEELSDGQWITAEGGGSLSESPLSNGTVCRIETKDPFTKDSLNRVLVGWWSPELLHGWDEIPDTDPVLEGEKSG